MRDVHPSIPQELHRTMVINRMISRFRCHHEHWDRRKVRQLSCWVRLLDISVILCLLEHNGRKVRGGCYGRIKGKGYVSDAVCTGRCRREDGFLKRWPVRFDGNNGSDEFRACISQYPPQSARL